MRIKAAVLHKVGEPLSIEEVNLDPPRAGEVLVKMVATGICHSDLHVITGDRPQEVFPVILGHEGAGIVEQVGPGVTKVAPGDHAVLTFLPACGTCHWCRTGQSNMCDLGALVTRGKMLDGTMRHHLADGTPVANFLFNSTFGEYTVVPEASLVKVDPEAPLERVCLLGCGFTTGYGSTTNALKIRPGETITIVGCGGLGLSAIQGAKNSSAGKIIAVDVHPEKLEMAKKFGATHTVQNLGDPQAVVNKILEITWGLGTDYSTEYVGFNQTEQTLFIAFYALRKGGTMCMVGVGAHDKRELPIDPRTLTLWNKKIKGVLFGQAEFQTDIPRYVTLAKDKQIDLDGLVTRELSLDQINEGVQAVLDGNKVARQVIRF